MNQNLTLLRPARCQWWLLVFALFAFGPLPAIGSEPVVSKLFQTGRDDYRGFRFGVSVAVSEKWLLVGADERGVFDFLDFINQGPGSVSVFDTRTRRLVRRLAADDGVVGNEFGRSVSVFGDLALVGALDAAYVFDLRTGRQMSKLSAPEDNVGFGSSVSLSGRLALVGSPNGSGLGPMTGVAWVYDLDSGGPPQKLAALDGSGAGAGDNFGESVSLCGNLALIGAYLDSHSGKSQAGSAYVFDARSGAQLFKLLAETPVDGGQFGERVSIDGNVGVISSKGPLASTPPTAFVFDLSTGTRVHQLVPGDSVSFDGFGSSISVDGNLALIGAPGSVRKAAYLFNLGTGEEIAKIPLPDPKGNDFDFASSVALCGDFAVIGFLGDIDRGVAPFSESGAAYFFRPLARPLPLPTLTQTRNFAPGTEEADFLSLLDPVINPQGETAFAAALTGPGAGPGTARRGIWSDAAPGNPLGLTARGGTDIGGGLLVNATAKPIYNRPDDLIFQGSVRGAGVNGGNNTALFRSVNGGAPNAFLRKGDGYPQFAGAVLERFLEVSQSHTGNLADVAVAFQYRFGPGGVSPISDTGILAVDHDGSLRDFFNEDWFLDSVADTIWAQFTPRSSMVGSQMAWSAFLKGPAVNPGNNMGLFRILPGAAQEVIVARKGDPVTGGGVMRSFLGEAINPNEIVTYRASLSGAGVENEKLQFGNENVWTKGDLVDNIAPNIQPGARIVRVLKFWPTAGGRVIFLAKMTGPGVNASNDCALWLWDDGSTQLLMREGEYAPDCDGARIGVIQRVDVDPQSAHYVILASLTGSPAANQALFTGDGAVGNAIALKALRLPAMKLRKGTSYQAALGETTRLLSLSLTNTNDRFGAGAKGGPQVIDNQGRIVVSARFTNRAWELLSGKP